jgi:hypothetical protein
MALGPLMGVGMGAGRFGAFLAQVEFGKFSANARTGAQWESTMGRERKQRVLSIRALAKRVNRSESAIRQHWIRHHGWPFGPPPWPASMARRIATWGANNLCAPNLPGVTWADRALDFQREN